MQLATLSGVADWLSIIGFPVALVGFAITIWQVRAAKKASQAACDAVDDFRQDMVHLNVVEQLARTVESIENLKRLLRANEIRGLPEMFSSIRKALISVRESYPPLNDAQQQHFQNSITAFKVFEEKIEKHISDSSQPFNVPGTITRISNLADELHTVLAQIRKKIEREKL